MKKIVLQIDIAGTRYLPDLDNEILIPVEEGLKEIRLREMEVAMDHEWEYSGYYDLTNRCQYIPADEPEITAPNVIGFAIPSLNELKVHQHTTLVIYAETVSIEVTDLAKQLEERQIKTPKQDINAENKASANDQSKKKEHSRRRSRHL